uniref:Uncharacterized protein n=1 Tax=Coccolithus braarudii TaxID=221442 RepID=A0A7S0Q6Z3_9EUKA|mmetsp:Transcript_43964/g.93566  ORF Transcript_43964/g.93566 Transcript_43964/m.93566 type:complete len:434 (+) Transcript_43964:211-1512(+)|eukprot:CAMPEP_0183332118 /NCGR_PEP_ID=MMETSP0164_2-20130417/1360_1 /TAXON_ID=221442 /ORGANISM="Coccolithus pelagicus ssp braarudi, Strain PLY182g" /LENGTH=433 /DNA_ID=CAMNT_0025500759 /DNA_START=204 /DNA_END=1505 /DNA_ORIENTATION=-
MRVIFLDVDGVIDSHGRKRNHLETGKVDRLVEVVKVTGARIVISSHWRLVKDPLRQLTEALTYLGVEIIGATPVHLPWEPERPLEIAEWLEAYNLGAQQLGRPHVTAFVAVDDRSLLTETGGRELLGRFVQTDKVDGLTRTAADRMIELFREQDWKSQAAALPAVPGLPNKSSLLRLTDQHEPGAFGVPRLVLRPVDEHAAARRALRGLADEPKEPKYTCTDFWPGTVSPDRVAQFGDKSPRPTPWIMVNDKVETGRFFKSTGRTSSGDALVKMRGFLHKISPSKSPGKGSGGRSPGTPGKSPGSKSSEKSPSKQLIAGDSLSASTARMCITACSRVSISEGAKHPTRTGRSLQRANSKHESLSDLCDIGEDEDNDKRTPSRKMAPSVGAPPSKRPWFTTPYEGPATSTPQASGMKRMPRAHSMVNVAQLNKA